MVLGEVGVAARQGMETGRRRGANRDSSMGCRPVAWDVFDGLRRVAVASCGDGVELVEESSSVVEWGVDRRVGWDSAG